MKKIIMLVSAAALVACGGKDVQPPAAAAITPAVQNAPAPSLPAAQNTLDGTVAETMNSGGYTYVRVKTGSGGIWAAVRETTLRTGETVSIAPQLTLQNFESSTLKRKFDSIVFGTLAGDVPPAMSHGRAAAGDVKEVKAVSVERAQGGRTVAEVWAARKDLAGKPVIVRGTVVKFLPDIMGSNWLHIRDGSGTEAAGDHDLTVTTAEVVAKGDVVMISGTLATDKDFGAGYTYAVIVENAKVTR